jgi:hypothetical protein
MSPGLVSQERVLQAVKMLDILVELALMDVSVVSRILDYTLALQKYLVAQNKRNDSKFSGKMTSRIQKYIVYHI